MKLLSFEVHRYRNVLDSGVIDVAPDVTCLVGKNEAGKSTLLQALTRLNPAIPASFDVDEEYPRWMKVQDKRKGPIEEARPISATFELEPADIEAIEDLVGEGVVPAAAVNVRMSYTGHQLWGVVVDEERAVSNLLDRITMTQPEKKALTKATFAEVEVAIESERATAADGGVVEPGSLDLVEAAIAELVDGAKFENVLPRTLRRRLPKFFYYDSYASLPGRTDLTELGGEDEPATSDLQTVRALLRLAETDVDRLGEDDYEVRTAELEAVSNDLTRQVFEYWKQNQDLEVVIDIDKETVDTGNGQTAVARVLDVRVRDKRHGFTNNFSQRSSGFQWFFSFLAAFSEFEYYDSGVVILLDEPALSLHARAQADFLRFINERIASAGQVIYTTHSPFMVETAKLDRVRVVEDRGPEVGAVVTSDVFTTDTDTIFPLQAALGYDIAQSLFIAPESLIVEGSSDFTYLVTLSEYLASEGRVGLDERFTVTPVGGVTNILTFVALLGVHVNVTVLIDSGVPGEQKLTSMASAGRLDKQRLVTIGEITGSGSADIEDLFTPGDYLKLYNLAFSKSLKVSDITPGGRMVKRIADGDGGDFDHGRPADQLLRHRDELLSKLSAGSLDNFEKLFVRLNETLPPAE